MTQKGVDEAWSRASIDALKAAGVTFVCRYLSYDNTGKNLTPAEAQQFSDAGIQVVSNWEYATQAALNGNAQGVKDATNALAQHNADGGPADAPIYFSVDFDVNDYAPSLSNDPGNARAKLGPIAAYFDGIISVLGVNRTGAYGGYWAIKRLFDAGLIKYGWQTYAWSGGQWDSRDNIRQVQNDVNIGGASVDIDTAMTDSFGGWKVGAPVTPTQPAPPPPPPAHPAYPGRNLVFVPPNHYTIGNDVRTWQQRMHDRGWRIVVDGDYGPASKAVCIAFQQEKHLMVDGIVGPQTWNAAWTAPITH